MNGVAPGFAAPPELLEPEPLTPVGPRSRWTRRRWTQRSPPSRAAPDVHDRSYRRDRRRRPHVGDGPGGVDAGHLVEDLHLQARLDLSGVSRRQFAGQRQRPARGKLKEWLAGLLAFGAVHRDHLRGQRRQEDHVCHRHAAGCRCGVAKVLVVEGHRILGCRAEEPGRVAVLVVPERGQGLLQFRHVRPALTWCYVPPCGHPAGQCEQRLAVYLGELLAVGNRLAGRHVQPRYVHRPAASHRRYPNRRPGIRYPCLPHPFPGRMGRRRTASPGTPRRASGPTR